MNIEKNESQSDYKTTKLERTVYCIILGLIVLAGLAVPFIPDWNNLILKTPDVATGSLVFILTLDTILMKVKDALKNKKDMTTFDWILLIIFTFLSVAAASVIIVSVFHK